MAKTISHCQGKGSLTHNLRTFSAKNVDSTRTPDNVIFKQQPIDEAYDYLFSPAVQGYNDKQKRADRKIKTNYFEYAFGRKDPPPYVVTAPDKRKSFYEDVVQIGTMHDTGCGTVDAKTAAECLKIYAEGFQARNPNLYVFLSTLHNDEATPHLHIDYIPVGHGYKKGPDTQNGIAQALKEMGFDYGKDSINRWRIAERAVLEQICREHGIEIAAPQKSRGSLTVEKFKEYAEISDKVDEKKQEAIQLDENIVDKKSTINRTDEIIREKISEIEEKNNEVEQLGKEITAVEARLEQAQKNAAQIDDITEYVQQAEQITRFGKPTGDIKIPYYPFCMLKKAAQGYIDNKRELERLNSEIRLLNRQLESKDKELNGLYKKTAMMNEMGNQNRTMKRALGLPEDAMYKDIFKQLTDNGMLQTNQNKKRTI